MPQTRKSSGPTAAKQSKLSFAHRVTKPVAKSGKDLGHTPSSLLKEVVPAEEKAKSPPASTKAVNDDEGIDGIVPGEGGEDARLEDVEVEPKVAPEPAKSAAELRAEKVSDAQVASYWKALEAERMSRRVHQEDLSVGEKVLRYFDVSSQYGPCIGIQRRKRWLRAERLGLNPPIEVLAVLLKEEKRGSRANERAHMDEIMNSTAIGATD